MVKQYRLDRDERARCIEMRDKGYTYQHIADVLGRNVKTVRKYLNPIEKERKKEHDAMMKKRIKEMVDAAEQRRQIHEKEYALLNARVRSGDLRALQRLDKLMARDMAWYIKHLNLKKYND